MYKRNDVKWREEGDGVFIFCPVSSEMFKLNETGKIVWMEIENSSANEISKKISKEYKIDHETALNDVRTCITDLLKKQLLIEA